LTSALGDLGALGGALAGLVLGAGVWRLAGCLAARYPAGPGEEEANEPVAVPAGGQGLVWLPAALVLASLGLWGAYVGWRGPGIGPAVAALLVTGLLLTISLVDVQVRRIPDPLVLTLLGWALAQVLWLGQPTLPSAALGLAAGGGLFFVLALIGRGAMGAGDVKLAAALGALLGVPLVFSGLLAGVLVGGAAALWLLATGRAGRKDPMAYGPCLALGAWIVWTRSLGLWS
jgi:leader peptidase (prepilin peptidase)/N-methyltransferase